ncbi:MAG: hypothetical protein MZW92_52120 [Comamonadaceae bacterium]|nr:hypothetical protein [Comamonadaceae bacterium]
MTYALEAVAIADRPGRRGGELRRAGARRARREFGMLRHIGMTRRPDRRPCWPSRARWSPRSASRPGWRWAASIGAGADPRRQPPVVPLEHGPARAVGGCSRRSAGDADRAGGAGVGGRRRGSAMRVEAVRAVREDW